MINKIEEELHRIKVKLYPSYLPKALGAYYAKTENEKVLGIENICSAMVNRGGFMGNYQTLLEYVRQFYDELAYQLCDGFAVNTGYYSIHPDVTGSIESAWKTYDKKKNPVKFKFRVRKSLRNLADHIDVVITGVADSNAIIHGFHDNYGKDSANHFAPGDVFTIFGNKIKITEEDPESGVFFVPALNPEKAVKVKRIIQNYPGKVIGEAPDTGYQMNRIEVRTRFSGSKKLMKNLRVITSSFELEQA